MESEREKECGLTVSLMPEMSPRLVSLLVDKEISASELIEGDMEGAGRMIGVSLVKARLRNSIEEARIAARSEMRFCGRHSIRILTPWDDAYPRRLLETVGFPLRLFMLGECDLNNANPVAIIGTRRATDYGLKLTARTVKELAPLPGLSIISGLALGIDGMAHRTALEAGVPTVGVLAHGLSRLYPAEHRDLAARMVKAGGALLTEYLHDERPFRGRFLERNRIVAGLTDGTLVVESGIKGGAMSTARIAFENNRSVMAFPGRATDSQSEGCNLLIRQSRASLVSSTSDILTQLGCDPEPGVPSIPAASLFPALTGEGARLYELLHKRGTPQSLDQLSVDLAIPVGRLISLVSELEFDGVLSRLPGNRVELC